MDNATLDFVRAGSLEELKAKGRIVVHGRHRPILLVHEDGHVFALDNRCLGSKSAGKTNADKRAAIKGRRFSQFNARCRAVGRF